MAAKAKLVGQRFGRLSVVSEAGTNKYGRALWLCICDCGKEKVALGKTLSSGRTRSCGCLHAETALRNIPSNAKPIGFERITPYGYVEVKTQQGFARKHVCVMEAHIGRKLREGEVVHHIDHNKKNNDIGNLLLMTNAEHTALHNKTDPVSAETGRSISRANRKFSAERARKARELVGSGMSQRKAARELGMSAAVVSRIIRNVGYTEI